MQQQETYQNLAQALKSALGILELDKQSSLYRDTLSICDYLAKPKFRIAVFGPFNYGKSTLLNALLGTRALPIDIVPTTGAAIYVNYGDELHAKIRLNDGTEISEPGIQILKQFAILDEQRRMRNDVASVHVYCPHPFLKTGVELLDLPGTDDQEAQDRLVREKLLTADLVVQVLDARKLMTLGERETLRDWLLDRGIKTVVFVANFLNLLEPDEQKQVYNRLLFVAESFRSDLPNNISNLYRVDALPALRARLKGEVAAAQTTGLTLFESALQSIATAQQEKTSVQFPRIQGIATQIKQVLQEKIQGISTELDKINKKHHAKLEITQKAEKLIKQGFQSSVSDFEIWLYLPKLIERYQASLATALQQATFNSWETEFKQAVSQHQQGMAEWVNKACDFFEKPHPGEFSIAFPPAPQVTLPPPPKTTTISGESEVAPVAFATGLGWLFGGPVGAAVMGGATYIVNKTIGQEPPAQSSTAYVSEVKQLFSEAAKTYLTQFSSDTFSRLQIYKATGETLISVQDNQQPLGADKNQYQLDLLNGVLAQLNQNLETFQAQLKN